MVRWVFLPPVAVICAGCGLEGPVVNLATRDKSTLIPDASDNVVVGRVPGAPPGTKVGVFQGTGPEIAQASGSTGSWDEPIAGPCATGLCAQQQRCRWPRGGPLIDIPDGSPVPADAFSIRFPGTSTLVGLRLDIRWRGGHRIGLVPIVEKQVSVLDNEACYPVFSDPNLAIVDLDATVASLILMGKALNECKPLSSFPPEMMTSLAKAVRQSSDSDVLAFKGIVKRLSDAAGQVAQRGCTVGAQCGGGTPLYPFAGEMPQGARVCDLINKEFLDAFGDGLTQEDFARALLAAEAALRQSIEVCYSKDTIRVVFLVVFKQGALDGNCAAVDPFKWASDEPNKTIYFTGGVHKTTPVCGRDGTPPACLTEEQVDKMNQLLGNWVPNQIRMYDDGTHGDAVKDDSIFTLVLDLPYFDPALAPDGRGVRLGYKYTYGFQGQGWTKSEEWPGNQRLLELVDVNGDHLIVRMDVFGDEATNKDKANLLKPANGGCGVNYWENEVRPGCAHDTRERMVDTDGDCVPEAWPTLHTASPILVPCR